MSRSASGALLVWTDNGGLSSSQRVDLVRIAMRLAGYEPRVGPLKGSEHDALIEALLPERLRPGKPERKLSLERCVSVMLGGMVPEDKILTLLVNKKDSDGNATANCWQEHVTSPAARGEYYISEAVRARSEIRCWAAEEARQAVVLALTGVSPDAPGAPGDAQQSEEEEEAAVELFTPAAVSKEQAQAPTTAPPLAHQPGPKPAPPPARQATLACAKPPPAPKAGPARAAPFFAAPPPPPCLGLSRIRVRVEVNDEMFTVTPSDLQALGLCADKLAAWYALKAGRPAGRHGGDSPTAVKLAAARSAAALGDEGCTPAGRGVKRLGGGEGGGGRGEDSPPWEGENAPPGDVGRLAKRAVGGGTAGASCGVGGAREVTPVSFAPGAASASPAGSPLPLIAPEHERAFSAALLSLTGRQGECSLSDLEAAVATAMPVQALADCLKVFEAANKLMAVDRTIILV